MKPEKKFTKLVEKCHKNTTGYPEDLLNSVDEVANNSYAIGRSYGRIEGLIAGAASLAISAIVLLVDRNLSWRTEKE